MSEKSKKILIACRNITFFLCLLFFYCINVLFVFYTPKGLYDFGSFIAAGQFAKNGENPYSEESPLIFSAYFPAINHAGLAPNLNPPISVLIFESIAEIPPQTSVTIWRFTTFLLFVISIFIAQFQLPAEPSPPNTWRIFWAFGMAGIWHTVHLGQIYALMLILAVTAWVYLKNKKDILGGIALGLLIAIKPNFVFWAIALFFFKSYAAFWAATVAAFIVSFIPTAFFGVDIYLQWLEASTKYTPDLLIFPANNSIQGLLARFNLPQVGIIISTAIAIYALIYIKNKRALPAKVNSIGVLVSLLVSPIAWTGYTLLAIPIMLEEKNWDWKYWSAAFIFMVPFYFPLILFQSSFFSFIVFGWFYGWGLLLLLFSAFNKKESISM